jgi:putative flippase GtrA
MRGGDAARMLRFLLVGGLSTLAHYLLLALLVEWSAVGVLPATAAGYVLGAVVNYLLNRRFTFRSARAHGAAVPRFVAVWLAGLLATVLLMALWVQVLGWHWLPAQAVTTVLVLVLNYFGHARFAFRST